MGKKVQVTTTTAIELEENLIILVEQFKPNSFENGQDFEYHDYMSNLLNPVTS